MAQTSIGDRIREMICEELAYEPHEIGNDTALFTTGAVDSFTFVAIVSMVEAELGYELDPAAITTGNFDSIQRIVDFLDRERTGTGNPA